MLPSERRCVENVIGLLCRGRDKVENEDEVLLKLIEKDKKDIEDVRTKVEAGNDIKSIYAEYDLSVYNKDISSIKESYGMLKKAF